MAPACQDRVNKELALTSLSLQIILFLTDSSGLSAYQKLENIHLCIYLHQFE